MNDEKPTIGVVIATTLRETLKPAVESALAQGVSAKIYVCVDGEQPDADQGLMDWLQTQPVYIVWLPESTGHSRWCGHRIYGAMCYLVEGCDYITWLDDDNIMHPDHLSTLLATAEAFGWAYSLRSLLHADGTAAGLDNCESLGHWSAWTGGYRLIDVSCYLLPVTQAVKLSKLWYNQVTTRPPDRFLPLLLDPATENCTGRHTLGYRLGSTPESVQPEFFAQGNARMARFYPTGFPWIK